MHEAAEIIHELLTDLAVEQYTCYDGNFLCPKINGDPTLRCGSACYLPGMYK
jgi:hypothetical protein